MFGFLRKHRWSIDLGSSQIRICKDGKLVLEEPALVEIYIERNAVVAVGKSALFTSVRDPELFRTICPINGGEEVDYEFFIAMMMRFRKEKLKKYRRVSWVLVAVSDNIMSHPAELQKLEDCLKKSFARKVRFISTSAAAAIELGLV